MLQKQLLEQERVIDTFYSINCEWPELIAVGTPKEVLIQLEEVISKFRHCFIRHNGWVGGLKGDIL